MRRQIAQWLVLCAGASMSQVGWSAPDPPPNRSRAMPQPTVQLPLKTERELGNAGRSEVRRRPGGGEERPGAVRPAVQDLDPNRLSALQPVAAPRIWQDHGQVPIPDRWRVLDTLGVVRERWWDPYNQNTIKADKPVHGDWFFNLLVVSDTVFEPRRLPTPVGPQSTTRPGSLDINGEGRQHLWNENLIVSLIYYQGDTTFRPPDWEFRLTPVFNLNYTRSREDRLLRIDPREGRGRSDGHVALQEAFIDYHIRNVSDRYDFDSVRIGIQPFSTDFRGFLFQDNQLALRFFGTRDNNFWQYNLVWIRRLEKDTNSGLNDVATRIRDDDLYVANLIRQDWPVRGFFSQGIVAHNRNRESDRFYFDNNGILARPASLGGERPRDYHVTYAGYNGDGHFGRLNLTVASYLAFGRESTGTFRDGPRDILAGFAAAEAGVDFSWIRYRISLLWASGDSDPFDDEANGFDAVFENPIFAGADTSFYIRQPVPLIGGGAVALSTRNGLLNNLRHSKEHGQSNFANPGLRLAGLGTDLDLLPELRLSFNANYLWFDHTGTLEAARNQGNISRDIGLDLSTALIWRPWMHQNVVFRLSGAALYPGTGFRDLYPDRRSYSVLANLVLTY
jgi:hypothetical protein